MLNLDDLKALIAVAQEGTLRAAAERLNKTQSAISQALRRLEEALDVSLFDRSGYRVTLTPQGEELIQRSKLLVSQVGQLKQYASVLASGQEQVYRIAIHSSLPESYYLPLVKQLSERYRDTVIHLFHENVGGAFLRLEREEADLAITPWHAISTVYRTIESKALGTIRMVNVVRRDLLAANVNGEDVLNYFRTVRQIIVKSSVEGERDSYGVIDGGCYIHVSDMTLKIDMIRMGLGWGRVPAHRVHAELSSGLLATVELPTMPGELSVEVRGLRNTSTAHGPVAATAWDALSLVNERCGARFEFLE